MKFLRISRRFWVVIFFFLCGKCPSAINGEGWSLKLRWATQPSVLTHSLVCTWPLALGQAVILRKGLPFYPKQKKSLMWKCLLASSMGFYQLLHKISFKYALQRALLGQTYFCKLGPVRVLINTDSTALRSRLYFAVFSYLFSYFLSPGTTNIAWASSELSKELLAVHSSASQPAFLAVLQSAEGEHRVSTALRPKQAKPAPPALAPDLLPEWIFSGSICFTRQACRQRWSHRNTMPIAFCWKQLLSVPFPSCFPGLLQAQMPQSLPTSSAGEGHPRTWPSSCSLT